MRHDNFSGLGKSLLYRESVSIICLVSAGVSWSADENTAADVDKCLLYIV